MAVALQISAIPTLVLLLLFSGGTNNIEYHQIVLSYFPIDFIGRQ